MCFQFLFSTSYFQNNLQTLFEINQGVSLCSTWVFLSKSNRLDKARGRRSHLFAQCEGTIISLWWLWFSGGSPVIPLLPNNCILRHLSTFSHKFLWKNCFHLDSSGVTVWYNFELNFFFSGEDDKHLWNVSKIHSSKSFFDKPLPCM